MAAALVLLQERPEHPPSASAALQWAQREKDELHSTEDTNPNRNAAAVGSMLRDFRALSENANYMFLVAAFSLIQGLNYAFRALVGQILEPCGYSAVDAGNASAILAGAGILGNVVVAPIMQVRG